MKNLIYTDIQLIGYSQSLSQILTDQNQDSTQHIPCLVLAITNGDHSSRNFPRKMVMKDLIDLLSQPMDVVPIVLELGRC